MSSFFKEKTNDSNSQKLRVLLDSIEASLTIPFLERRGRSHSHKSNPVEELQDAVNELSEKEKELSAAVGIAKMLLDKNDKLQEKKKKILDRNDELIRENLVLRLDIKNHREMMMIQDDKYEIVSESLAKTEVELMQTAENHQKLIIQRSFSNEFSTEIEIYKQEIADLKDFIRKDSEKTQSKSLFRVFY